MREIVDRAYFSLCLALGRLIRFARYSTVRIVRQGGTDQVKKSRSFYAPLLVGLGNVLVKLLDAGVRVLPKQDWVRRERSVYRRVHGASIRLDPDGMLVLPRLPGVTLAALLEDPSVGESYREKAIELAVVALADLHEMGFTHADAMAENILIDLESGTAHWFDFETVHDTSRSFEWRRADDVRALLVTCLARTVPERLAATLRSVLRAYPDERVTRLLVASFDSVWRRSLAIHLVQAKLSFQRFREIARLLGAQVRHP